MAKVIKEIKNGITNIIPTLTWAERKSILSELKGSLDQLDIFVCEQIRYYNITGRLL